MKHFYKINLILDLLILVYVIIAYACLLAEIVYGIGGDSAWMTLFIWTAIAGFLWMLHAVFMLVQLFFKERRSWKTFWYAVILSVAGFITLFLFSTSLIWVSWLEAVVKKDSFTYMPPMA